MICLNNYLLIYVPNFDGEEELSCNVVARESKRSKSNLKKGNKEGRSQWTHSRFLIHCKL